jgi:DNA-binding NarL/FixJ family response regulator
MESSQIQTALIVEDIPEVNQWMAEMLAAVFPAITIYQAYTLKQAFHLLKHAPNYSRLSNDALKTDHPQIAPSSAYDLALIDLGLPDGCGLEIIEHCALHHPDMISIVVTIFEDDQHLFKALHQGAQGYLLKDLQPAVFQQNLRQIAQGEAVLSPLFVKKMLHYMRQIGLNRAISTQPVVLPLTPREKQVLGCIGRGLQVNETAQSLNISVHTVSSYIKEIYRKLNISSRAEAVLVAVQYGLI